MQTRSRLAAANTNAPTGLKKNNSNEENKGVSKVLASKNATMSKVKAVKKEVLPSKKRSALGDVSNVQQNQVITFNRRIARLFNRLTIRIL